MNPTVAVVAQGAMGAGVGGRLVERGLTVLTSLEGRSEASARRAKAAGMVAASDVECAQADFFLSICPPSEAMALAEKMAALIKPNNKKPIYVDCNAVSPPTKVRIGEVIARSGAPFVDGGIIGLPPKPGNAGPTIYVSGPHAARAAALGDFGVRVAVLDAPNGAASALKMSYAGITKGLIALATTMALGAERAGVAEALTAELRKSQPNLAASFAKSVPDMLGKARRWVPEMNEIAHFLDEARPEAGAYRAFAGLYAGIADADAATLALLRDFYTASGAAA
jgi:3-hydroxyisobutyrate dehydrogenase-like beta-hydroxyacid dehydrogenase